MVSRRQGCKRFPGAGHLVVMKHAYQIAGHHHSVHAQLRFKRKFTCSGDGRDRASWQHGRMRPTAYRRNARGLRDR